MHFHKAIKYQAVLAMILLLLQVCLMAKVAFSNDEQSDDILQSFSNLFESADKENKHLLNGWNDYLVKVLRHSNAEHIEVIGELTMDYANAFKSFNEKLGKERKKEKMQYTSNWLDRLVEHFGQDFVCKNKIAILLNLMMAFDRNDEKKYAQDAKDILSKEMILYLAYEEYFDTFVDYYNNLNENDQKQIKNLKEVAEKYLSITKRSHFAPIYYGGHMRKKIDNNVMQKEHKALYDYFKKANLDFGRGALQKAERDMDMFVESCKMQNYRSSENGN
jgi:hypothetical protein